MSIYVDALKRLPKEDIDHNSFLSDLYLRNTNDVWDLIREFKVEKYAHIFIDAIEHRQWVELKGVFFPVEIYKEIIKDKNGNDMMSEHYIFNKYDYETKMFTYTNGIYNERYRKEIQIPLDEIDNWHWRGIAW